MVAKTNQTFQREFAKLNTAQRQAVETIEGPVMVIAGPGTGKTQVVAMRIAQILQKTQLDPRNILALTFTEAGVTTLRTRLETIIGSDAYQVGIFTFHSFASEIIGTFAYVFPQVSDNGQLSDLDRLQIIDRIVISDKSLINLRPSRQPSFHIPAIATAIQKLKQEAILPQLLVELSEVETKTALVSSKNTVQRELLTKRLVTNLELAKILGNYQDYLAKHQLYDFEDMILLATDALQNNHDVKGYYQERYQYLLVDEYQDTNNAQNALVEALADFFDTPNLFVVGDDKQAIYRFQGASVANMLHFTKKYPKIVTISLIDNYRNSQGLLNAASELINHNRHQLHECLPKIHSQLRSVSNNKARPIVVEAKSEEAQTAWLIEEIKKLQAKKVSLTDIAVLFRTNKEMAEFRTLAEKNGLDVSGNFSTNLLAEPEIRRLINLLRAVNQPTDDESLLTALPIIDGNINITHLAPVSWQGRRGQPLAGQFAKSAAKSLVKTAVEKILNLNRLASQQTLGELVESIVSGSDVLVALNSFPDRVERLEMIRAFIEEVGRFSQKHPQATLTGLLEYFDSMANYRITIAVNRLTPETGGLTVSTVHGVKGLEFGYVFVANATDHNWRLRQSRSVIRLPMTIVRTDTNSENDPIEDERRLFYVGMTRARHQLYLSWANQTNDGRTTLPCRFVSEMDGFYWEQKVTISKSQAEQFLTTSIMPVSQFKIKQRELKYIRERISQEPFSFTDWAAYKACPRRYLLVNLFRFPTKESFSLTFGSAVHRALELFFKQYKAREKLPSVKTLTDFFDQALRRLGPVSDQEIMADKGQKLLAGYYEKYNQSWPIPVGVEYSFRSHHVLLDDIWLTGKYDRIDPLDPLARTVRIVDYKTGSKSKTRGEIEGTTKNSDGSIKSQLVFYSLLAKLDRHFPYKIKESNLDFLDDAGSFRQERFEISQKEIDQLKKDIIATYQQILTDDKFPHTGENLEGGCELCGQFELS